MSEKRKNIVAACVLAFGLVMIARGLWKRARTPLGGACTIGSDECKGGTCMGFGDRGDLCTKVCGHDDCPAGMKCEVISVSVVGAPGVAMNRDYKASYCVPNGASRSALGR